MFTDFLVALRRQGLSIGMGEWLTLHKALDRGIIEGTEDLYGLGRALLARDETEFDAYDLAFLEVFKGVTRSEVAQAIKDWLANPLHLEALTPEAFQAITGLSLEELRKKFQEMLEKQKERHDGGSRYIGTGGTSPFGTGGAHPTGIQVGGGGGRSAVEVAESRQFQNYRTDVTIDVRQVKLALKALRRLAKEGEEILDVDATISRTCDNGGEIDLVFSPDRKNNVRLLLLMDAGGSMTPYARLVDQLFTAASESHHWKTFQHYFFHNVVYGRLYTDIERFEGIPTGKIFRDLTPDTKVVFVGDACMAPWELSAPGGAYSAFDKNPISGLDWVRRIKEHFPAAIWLNPEPKRFWDHPTVAQLGASVPMFQLTLDGLAEGIRHLKRTSHVRRAVGAE